jgi:hypothetical protein
MPVDEHLEKPLSELKHNEKISVYCPATGRNTEVAKRYLGKGDRSAIADPGIYVLVCLQPWREHVEHLGFSKEKRRVNVRCGRSEKCDILYRMWRNEIDGIESDPDFFELDSEEPAKEKTIGGKEMGIVNAIGRSGFGRRARRFFNEALESLNSGNYEAMINHLERASSNTFTEEQDAAAKDLRRDFEGLYNLKHGKPDKKV